MATNDERRNDARGSAAYGELHDGTCRPLAHLGGTVVAVQLDTLRSPHEAPHAGSNVSQPQSPFASLAQQRPPVGTGHVPTSTWLDSTAFMSKPHEQVSLNESLTHPT